MTKAMRDELSRSIKELRISDLDKPYFISYRIDDTATTKISATLGQLTEENLYHGRSLSVSVRVGDFKLDNSNFLQLRSANRFDGDCGCHSTIPLDDDYSQIRREIWLAPMPPISSPPANWPRSARRSSIASTQKNWQISRLKLPPRQ